MKALVIVAHGSRREESNDEVRALTRLCADIMKDEYSIVEAGFLELAQPLIPKAIELCINQGAKSVLVVPYFLSAGRHVSEDIPVEVGKAQSIHAEVDMQILPHIGGSSIMVDLIKKSVADYESQT